MQSSPVWPGLRFRSICKPNHMSLKTHNAPLISPIVLQGLVGMTQTVAAMFVNQITRPLGERNALMLAFAGQVRLGFHSPT